MERKADKNTSRSFENNGRSSAEILAEMTLCKSKGVG